MTVGVMGRDTCSPPIITHPRQHLKDRSKPSPPTLLDSLPKSCRDLTVEDLKNDPALRTALRSLRDTMTAAAGQRDGRAATAPIVTQNDLGAVRSITGKMVARDMALRTELRTLKYRATDMKTERDSHKFSALGEVPRLPIPVHGPPRGWHPAAGKQTIASIGPGWIGPHRLMESYRRPTGPGNR